MALVVLLRGVNVGGHRTFRPTLFAQRLRRFGVVNIGAAGTFVVRQPVRQATLRGEVARLLPFDAQIVVCTGRDVLRFVASDPVALLPSDPRLVAFVSVLPKRCQPSSPLPQRFPPTGRWGLKIVGQHGRFVFGTYRREMRAINHLAQLDRLFGVQTTTRSWSTMVKIARLLSEPEESVAGVER
jgi:uncharacterized protein (DUF1697 family)